MIRVAGRGPLASILFMGVIGIGLAVGVLKGSGGQDPAFPHAAHERLFPVCEGCHLGVVTGVDAEMHPDPATCAQCHDGVREAEVSWTPPDGPRASNLRFSHPEHEALLAGTSDPATCQSCHALDTQAPRMAVSAAAPESCLQCHVHEAPTHLAAVAECGVCHLPLTEADALTAERIALFPWPASHDDPGFLMDHAPGTSLEQLSCATCHARQTCERCHLNADRLESITLLEPDERVASLELFRVAVYPLPESHTAPGWEWGHGETALGDPARCATCHAQTSCLTCHIGGDLPLEAIAQLPQPGPEEAQGVDLTGAGAGVHPLDFAGNHGTFAATGALDCAQCHVQRYCADCHDGTDSRDFHPDNFMERHAVEVFAGGGDCQSCHTTETFCRDCHVGVGVASEGRLDVAFHTAQPLWILSHGQAARVGLESCASCHRQTDCLACHSTVTGRGVNPHGPGFDAGSMAARNRATCRWCHLGDPLGGG